MEDTASMNWRKSSYSSNGGGECVEAANAPGTVAVRDSKDQAGPRVAVSPAAWRALMARIKAN